jgi:hypothetical protein
MKPSLVGPSYRGLVLDIYTHSKKVCVRKRSQGFCVGRTQTFVLDILKNTFIVLYFVLKIQKFHTNLCQLTYFSNYPTQICVLTTQKPCDRFQTQGLCCLNTKFLRVQDSFGLVIIGG